MDFRPAPPKMKVINNTNMVMDEVIKVPGQRAVQGPVKEVGQGFAFAFVQVFAYAVKHHDGIVQTSNRLR